MNKERQGELFMIGLAILESWFPILSISAMKYIGALHTYMYSLLIALVFFILIIYKRNRFTSYDSFYNSTLYLCFYRYAIHKRWEHGCLNFFTTSVFLSVLQYFRQRKDEFLASSRCFSYPSS